MAERRMFAKTIIDSDAFIDMPLSTQALYFHLSMRADDDGFLNNPKKVQRMIGCSDDDFKVLVAKRFIIPFESGVVVIKHWRIHNYIRMDRYKETVYQEEKSHLSIKENGAYTLSKVEDFPLLDDEIPFGIPSDNQTTYQMDTQVRLGKDSIDKDSKKENIKRKKKKDLTIDDIPNSFIYILDENNIDGSLREAFLYFILMRIKANTRFTEHALTLTIKKVKQMYPNNEHMQVECVNQSVEHGWLTIYEVKNGYKSSVKQETQNTSFATPLEYHYEEDTE